MGTSLRIALGGVLLGCMALTASPVLAAAEIKSQAPCVGPSGFCAQFFPTTDPIPVVRSFKYNAPSAGTASVSFHGALLCSNIAGNGNDRVVDVVSQIVTGPGVVADVTGPSGLRHAIVLFGRTAGTTDSFSLASTRDLAIAAAGPRTFYFKIRTLRMDAGTSCIIYNAAFTVLFVP